MEKGKLRIIFFICALLYYLPILEAGHLKCWRALTIRLDLVKEVEPAKVRAQWANPEKELNATISSAISEIEQEVADQVHARYPEFQRGKGSILEKEVCASAAEVVAKVLTARQVPYLVQVHETYFYIRTKYHSYIKLVNEANPSQFVIVDPSFRQFFVDKLSREKLNKIPLVFVGTKEQAMEHFSKLGWEAEYFLKYYFYTKPLIEDPRNVGAK